MTCLTSFSFSRKNFLHSAVDKGFHSSFKSSSKLNEIIYLFIRKFCLDYLTLEERPFEKPGTIRQMTQRYIHKTSVLNNTAVSLKFRICLFPHDFSVARFELLATVLMRFHVLWDVIEDRGTKPIRNIGNYLLLA